VAGRTATATAPEHEPGRADVPGDSHTRLKAHVGALGLYLGYFLLYFAPATLAGRLLAPGDGIVSYFPALYRSWSLWSPNIYSGYPAISDLQFLTWYPLRYLVPDYNLLVISAYVIAGFFTFCLAYRKLNSFWPAAVGGIVYASAGFMTAHLGHLTIIHSAAWAPLLLLAIDHLGERLTTRWVAAGALGVALSFLGGHPQIFAYSLALGATFAVYRICQKALASGWKPAARLALACAGVVMTGMAAAAIQILPSVEFQNLSNRAAGWSYADFSSYSLPLKQLPMAMFPFLFGGDSIHFPGYFGEWNLTELTIYSGAGTLLLAAVALSVKKGRSEAIFWLLIAVSAILMAVAPSTPIGKVIFHLPVIGDFRAPARAGFVLNFAVAMLVAIGMARIIGKEVSTQRVWISIGCVAAIVCATLFVATRIFEGQSASYQTADLPWLFIKLTGMQILLLALIAAVLVACRRWHTTRLVSATLASALAADLAAFGQFYEWKSGPETAVLAMQPEVRSLREEIMASKGRLLPLFPPVAPLSPLAPNLNDYYGIPSAGGYGPLGMAEYSALMSFAPVPDLAAPLPDNVLVAAAVSHIAYVKGPVSERTLGSCTPRADDQVISVKLSTPAPVSAVRLSSNTGCSVDLPTGLLVLQVSAEGSGSSETVNAEMGRDTAEWAYDRADVVDVIKHTRPQILSSFDAGGGNVGHVYVSDLPLARPLVVESLTLRFPAAATASLSIKSIALIGPGGEMTPVPLEAFAEETRRPFEEPLKFAGGIEVVRYRRSIGPAWLVDNTVVASPIEAIDILRSGLLPDGKRFDARTTAIISGEVASPPTEKARGNVVLDRRTADEWEITVQNEKPSLLVISQPWHPGWRAYVNGLKVPILRANAAFQGVPVPAGGSTVRIVFEPRSFIVGLLISAATLAGLALALALPHIKAWRRRRVAHALERTS